jgi:hypothetical protein
MENTQYLIFTGGKKKFYDVEINKVSENVISIKFGGEIPSESTMRGFLWYYNDKPLGNYEEYTTIYRYDGVVGIYQLSKDGSVYIPPEPVPEPEPYVPTPTEIRIAELNAIIAENKSLLAESDYKVIKNSEYAEAGIDVEYEPTELNAERQILRDAINVAETELATLTVGADDAG